jgi:hypothetical protein
MFLAPVIERELRGASHRDTGRKSRFRVAIIGASVVCFFMWLSTVVSSSQWGRSLNQMFFYAGLYLAIAPAARISVGLFSEERRNQTLELLYLTGMGSGQLFIGKLLGGTLIASADLLALVPLLAMPFLIGGISLNLYIATILCLPALLLFAISAGTLASVLFKDDGVAFIFMVAFAGCISLAAPIPYYLGKLLAGAPPFSAKWLCVSPAYAPYLVARNFGAVGVQAFWMAELTLVAWSVACLVLACFFLNRNWRSEIHGVIRAGWRGRFDAWLHGPTTWRAALSNSLLPAKPFQWLVQQERRQLLLGYCTVGLISVLWLSGWRAWPRTWPSNANFFITTIVLITTVNWVMLFAAARRIGTDRRDGILELLLTTHLSPEEIVEGEIDGLAAQFKPVQFIVLALVSLMMLEGFVIRSWNVRALITYGLIWCALSYWCLYCPKGRILQVMWAALNTGRPVYSVFKRRGSNNKITWFWMIYNLRNLFNGGFRGGTAAFPSGSVMEFTIVCVITFVAGWFYCISRGGWLEPEVNLRKQMVMDMRLIATEPIPDQNDPAYKNWDGTVRLRTRHVITQVRGGRVVSADPLEIARP